MTYNRLAHKKQQKPIRNMSQRNKNISQSIRI